MSLNDLLNLPVTLVLRTSDGAIDEFGNDVPTETVAETVAEIQQQQRAEPAAAGERSDDRWLCILPAGTALDTGDAIIANGQQFELIGAPWHARNPRTGLESHVECTLRRTATGDDDEGS